MITTKMFLKEIKQAMFELKADVRMLEGYSRFVDDSTAEYHDRLCGYINQHLADADDFVECLEKRLLEESDKSDSVA